MGLVLRDLYGIDLRDDAAAAAPGDLPAANLTDRRMRRRGRA
jgi:hypothetical protein